MRATSHPLAMLFVFSVSVFVAVGTSDAQVDSFTRAADPGEIVLDLDAGDLAVDVSSVGVADFAGSDLSWPNQTGEPAIPWRVVAVLLPPNASPRGLSVELLDAKYETLPGEYDVAPTPPAATWRDGRQLVVWPTDRQIVAGEDVEIYAADAPWPAENVKLLDVGAMRQWRIARVAVPLALYNPARGSISVLRKGTLRLRYETDPALSREVVLADRIGADIVREMCVNYAAGAKAYVTDGREDPLPGYAIITTSEVVAGSTQLSAFVAHQQTRGFNVQVVTESDFGGGVADTAAENIREWLKANYLADHIQYVLLIGNPITSSDLPMKVLYARYEDGSPQGHPSDFYYSDLTGNWDLDGDGYSGEGEPPDDFGVGGIDVHWEVLVGRIPYYGDLTATDDILARTMQYQSATGAAADWRRSVLLPMKPSDDDTPGYHLGEQIKADFAAPLGWGYHRVYEDTYDLAPPPETTPCSKDVVTDVWANDAFGLVVWWTHGSSTSASGVIDTSYVPQLNDAYPSFTFQVSCSNSYPENSGNLAYTLLQHGGICTVGGTRVTWYWIGETRFNGTSSNAGMGYQYAQRIVTGETAGLALHAMKQGLWNYTNMWPNFVSFVLFGDPSTYVVEPAAGAVHNITQDTCYNNVQAAVDEARAGDEIVLEPGIYTGPGNFNIMTTGMPITIRGTDPSDPNVVAATVIDCQASNDLRRRAFIFCSGEGPDTVIDGLTITGAYYANGGAIRCEYASSPTIRRCVLRENHSTGGGGAIKSINASEPTIEDCTFRSNTAVFGGAITNQNDAHATIRRCLFLGNSASSSGGAIDSSESSPTITDCTFIDNHADAKGGAVWSNTDSIATITNCTFERNTASDTGGAIANNDQAGAIISGCTFDSNASVVAGAIRNSDQSDGRISECLFVGNTASGASGALATVDHSDTVVADCDFVGNHSRWGGAIFASGESMPQYRNCRFLLNTVTENGGAADINNGRPSFVDCLVAGNQAFGSGIAGAFHICNGSVVTMRGLTICDNRAPDRGGVSLRESMLGVRDTILWGNEDNQSDVQAAQMRVSNGTLDIDYSCVEGWDDTLGGVGNHGLDPMFVDPRSRGDERGDNFYYDYHLLPGSPCIDAGDPLYTPAAGATDLDGEYRVSDGDGNGARRVDMGVDEFGSLPYATLIGDCDCDGSADLFDIDAFVMAILFEENYAATYPHCEIMLADCNDDGAPDVFDIDAFIAVILGG